MAGVNNKGATFGGYDAKNQPIVNVPDPTGPLDAMNRQAVDLRVAAGGQGVSVGNGPWYPGKAIFPLSQEQASTSFPLIAGTLYGACFTAPEELPVGHIALHSGGTLMVGGTLCRLGLVELHATNGWRDFTLLARADSDTNLFKTTASRPWEKALSTTGGYPASYVLTSGNRYAAVLLIVGPSTMPSIRTSVAMSSAFVSGGGTQLTALAEDRQAIALTGQTDIPASGTFGAGSIDRVPFLGVTI